MDCSAGHFCATAGGDKRLPAVTQGQPARVCLTVHAGAWITSRLVISLNATTNDAALLKGGSRPAEIWISTVARHWS
jgi:hypothetical protein